MRNRWHCVLAAKTAFIVLLITWLVYLTAEEAAIRRELLGIAIFSKERDSGNRYTHSREFLSVYKYGDNIMYNRVPKTGSTTFVDIISRLWAKNKLGVVHVSVSGAHRMLGIVDQLHFARNVSTWRRTKPIFFHGHMAFLDFTKFGFRNPLYINIVRDPLERMVSYYYFLRHGDNFRPAQHHSRAGNNETFDECVALGGYDCSPDRSLWVQIPFFCGHSDECRIPGSGWALSEAKHNLVHHYLLVGTTEHLGDFIQLIELLLPTYFAGASDLYNKGELPLLRRTSKRLPPKSETLAKLSQSQVWKMEREFYEFAKDNFMEVKNRILMLAGRPAASAERLSKSKAKAGGEKSSSFRLSDDQLSSRTKANETELAPQFSFDKILT